MRIYLPTILFHYTGVDYNKSCEETDNNHENINNSDKNCPHQN